MPNPINDDDDDRDTSGAGVVRRLNRVVDILARANARLDEIRAGFAEPPDPDKPATREALSAILTQSAHATTVANELMLRLGR